VNIWAAAYLCLRRDKPDRRLDGGFPAGGCSGKSFAPPWGLIWACRFRGWLLEGWVDVPALLEMHVSPFSRNPAVGSCLLAADGGIDIPAYPRQSFRECVVEDTRLLSVDLLLSGWKPSLCATTFRQLGSRLALFLGELSLLFRGFKT